MAQPSLKGNPHPNPSKTTHPEVSAPMEDGFTALDTAGHDEGGDCAETRDLPGRSPLPLAVLYLRGSTVPCAPGFESKYQVDRVTHIAFMDDFKVYGEGKPVLNTTLGRVDGQWG